LASRTPRSASRSASSPRRRTARSARRSRATATRRSRRAARPSRAGDLLLDARHRRPRSPIDFARAGSAATFAAQGLLLFGLRRHRLCVEERGVVAADGLLRVLVSEDLASARRFCSSPSAEYRAQRGEPALEQLQAERPRLIAQVLQRAVVSRRERRSPDARHEDEITVGDARGRPSQVRLRASPAARSRRRASGRCRRRGAET